MKFAYVIVPLALLTGFALAYVPLSAKKKEDAAAEKERVSMRENQAKLDVSNGKEFVGRDGKKEAEADISRGAPKLFLYGKTRGDIEERTAIFKQRFGVELDPLAGCIVSEPLVAFAGAYNAAIRSHIAAKFGATAFEEAEREAMRIWEAKKKKEANQSPEPTAPSGRGSS
jgi:hypothetical protein